MKGGFARPLHLAPLPGCPTEPNTAPTSEHPPRGTHRQAALLALPPRRRRGPRGLWRQAGHIVTAALGAQHGGRWPRGAGATRNPWPGVAARLGTAQISSARLSTAPFGVEFEAAPPCSRAASPRRRQPARPVPNRAARRSPFRSQPVKASRQPHRLPAERPWLHPPTHRFSPPPCRSVGGGQSIAVSPGMCGRAPLPPARGLQRGRQREPIRSDRVRSWQQSLGCAVSSSPMSLCPGTVSTAATADTSRAGQTRRTRGASRSRAAFMQRPEQWAPFGLQPGIRRPAEDASATTYPGPKACGFPWTCCWPAGCAVLLLLCSSCDNLNAQHLAAL